MSFNQGRKARPSKPPWLKVRAPSGDEYARIKSMRQGLGLATVCEEARCPNIGECWSSGTATFMVMGDTCTRACRFCNVKSGNPRGWLDHDEPQKIAEVIAAMDLSYVVLTMVDRDDLEDGGADHVARCVRAAKEASPDLIVEVLMGDFRGRRDDIKVMVDSGAEVLAHNVETVRDLTRRVRDGKSGYDQTLNTLRILRDLAPDRLTKTSIMLGFGETDEQVRETLRDLRGVGVDIVTLGQYLQPTPRHLPVEEFVTPERFDAWREEAEAMGFLFCASGPLVRSSYKAGELFTERYLREGRGRPAPFGV